MNRERNAEILVLPDADAVSSAAAERLATALRSAIDERGRADWATTGGSAPVAIYRRLVAAPLRDEVPWERVHVWWGDDRFVAHDHELSNVRPVDAVLLGALGRDGASGTGASGTGASGTGGSGTGGPGTGVEPGADQGVAIPTENVHPFPIPEAISGGHPPDWCAARYAEMLRHEGLDVVDGWPVFDAFLLGVGPDGHVLSVFPHSEAWGSTEWALGIPAPQHVEPHVPRVSLHPRTVEVSRGLVVVVHGGSKADAIGQIFGPERDERALPGQVARRPDAVWILDEAAASRLAPGLRGG